MFVGLVTAFASIALLPCAVARADRYQPGFEPRLLHRVRRRTRWLAGPAPTEPCVHRPQPYPIDQGIVTIRPSSRLESLASNRSRCASRTCVRMARSAGTQMYSPRLLRPGRMSQIRCSPMSSRSSRPTTDSSDRAQRERLSGRWQRRADVPGGSDICADRMRGFDIVRPAFRHRRSNGPGRLSRTAFPCAA